MSDNPIKPILKPCGTPLTAKGYRPIWRADGKLDKPDMYFHDGMSGRDNPYESPREMRFYIAPGRFDKSEDGAESMAIIEIGPGEGFDGPTSNIVLSTFDMEILVGLLNDMYQSQYTDRLASIHAENEAQKQATKASETIEDAEQPDLLSILEDA